MQAETTACLAGKKPLYNTGADTHTPCYTMPTMTCVAPLPVTPIAQPTSLLPVIPRPCWHFLPYRRQALCGHFLRRHTRLKHLLPPLYPSAPPAAVLVIFTISWHRATTTTAPYYYLQSTCTRHAHCMGRSVAMLLSNNNTSPLSGHGRFNTKKKKKKKNYTAATITVFNIPLKRHETAIACLRKEKLPLCHCSGPA